MNVNSRLSGNEKWMFTMEENANRFNLKCLAVLCGFTVLCEFCNRIGVFTVDPKIMNIAAATAMLSFSFPIVVWLIPDKLLKKTPSVLTWSGFKFVIVMSVFFGVTVTSVALTFHAILLLALPGIFAAQYSDQRQLLRWMLIASVILVPVSVYGGFFFGLVDRNFFGGVVGKENLTLEERIAVCPPRRYVDLFFHYVMPRFLSIVIIDILLSGIGRRNTVMVAKQMELAEKANEEMRKRNELQSLVIQNLSSLIESRDENTGEHVVRTRNYVSQLAHEMEADEAFRDQLTDDLVAEIENAAPLHDIGKIAVSDTILLKPGKLTPEEFEIIKQHTTKGGAMIRNLFSNLDDPLFLSLAEDIAVYHHEWWDGSGYPEGRSGREIPLAARIMAVADVYDALVSDRVYKKAIPKDQALEIIYGEAGTHFDPDIIRILKTIEARSAATPQ